MDSSLINGITGYTKSRTSLVNGRNDPQLADALKKISPEAQQKTRAKAQEFEAMFLNSMFSQMTTGVKGEGPFGDTTGPLGWKLRGVSTGAPAVATIGPLGWRGKMPPCPSISQPLPNRCPGKSSKLKPTRPTHCGGSWPRPRSAPSA